MAPTICSPRIPLAVAAGALAAVCGWAGPSSASTSSPASYGTPSCTASNLKVTNGGSQGAAGSVYTDIVFTNISGHTCDTSGYPGASLLTRSGRQVGAAATHPINQLPMLVTLAPGAKAHATLRVVDAGNYPRSVCRPVPTAWLRINPPVIGPNPTRSVRLRYPSTGCANHAVKLLSITSVGAGAGNP